MAHATIPMAPGTYLLDVNGNPTSADYTSLLAAPATGITVAGLAQYDAVEFELQAPRTPANGVVNILCKPNNSSANISAEQIFSFSGGAVYSMLTSWVIAGHNAADRAEYSATGRIRTVVGANRAFSSEGYVENATAVYCAMRSVGRLKDPTAPIASLVFEADTSLGMNTGTMLWVRGVKF